ncbi:MAG: hypothetical protein HY267_00165 [Deltaproteobacteria bacterium]|nr:hypothetical protein [Deltaproteobacteria bacterium]
MSTLTDQLTTYAQQKHLSPQTLTRWQAWTEADRTALWEVVQELQLGENHLRDVVDWCEEITLRDGGTITVLFARPEMHRTLTSKLGRNDKLKAVKDALRKIRYPHLSRLEDNLRAAIKALDLGGRVQVSFPPSLEGDEMTIEIKAHNVKELSDSLARLGQRLEDRTMQKLFDLLEQV